MLINGESFGVRVAKYNKYTCASLPLKDSSLLYLCLLINDKIWQKTKEKKKKNRLSSKVQEHLWNNQLMLIRVKITKQRCTLHLYNFSYFASATNRGLNSWTCLVFIGHKRAAAGGGRDRIVITWNEFTFVFPYLSGDYKNRQMIHAMITPYKRYE